MREPEVGILVIFICVVISATLAATSSPAFKVAKVAHLDVLRQDLVVVNAKLDALASAVAELKQLKAEAVQK